MRTRLRGKMTLLFMTFALLLAIPAIALADIVHNNVVAGGNDTITAGGSTTIKYRIQAQNFQQDGEQNCNATTASPAKLYISAPAAAVTVSGSDVKTDASDPNDPKKYLEFTDCANNFNTGQNREATFSSSSVGNHSITHSVVDSGPGEYTVSGANFALKVNAAPVTDSTPPVITPDIQGTLGNNGWYTSNVSLSWSVIDEESTISSSTGCDDVSITQDQAATTYTCEATSAGGTSSESVTIKRDATKPTLSPSVNPNPVLLNGSATASANASDVMSGVATQSCDPVDMSSVGSKSVSCTATDNAGHSANGTASYSVVYDFVGFTRPVDNPTVLNSAKAGQAIPLKWRLLDANGNAVTNLASANVKVTVSNYTCGLATTQDLVEEYAAGSSGLQNLGDGYYQFNWKTPTNYANSCKTMNLDVGEGTGAQPPHTALFKFTK